MPSIDQSTIANRLLASLSAEAFASLSPSLVPVVLPVRFSLAQAGAPIERVYFPNSGLASIIATSPEGQSIEAGLFGRDGFGSCGVALGSNLTPYTVFMQAAGEGYSIDTSALTTVMDESPPVRLLLLRFIHVLNAQTSFTALSNAVHQIDVRLARWLLMCHDRSETDEMALTHEFLSLMLAVRRSSVTSSLHVLAGNGFISLERGSITIRNRARLEEFASDAYGTPEAEYRRLIGPMR